MDPLILRMAEAFGTGGYDECRRLANSVLDSGDDPALRSQAAAYLIESHLAEGDFDGARAAAQQLKDQDALARVDRLEADYTAEIGRLQLIAATAGDRGEAARAHLLSATVHQQVGRPQLALESYWKVVRGHPQQREAGDAIARIARLHVLRGRLAAALTACEEAVSLAPDGLLGARSCQTLVRIGLADPAPPYRELRRHLSRIAATYSETRAGDVARLGIGQAYAAEGIPHLAETVWTDLLLARPESEVASHVYASLVRLQYDAANKCLDDGDLLAASRWLERCVAAPALLRPGTQAAALLERDRYLRPGLEQNVLVCLGETYENTGQWQKGARIYERLAVPGCSIEELALYRLAYDQLALHRYEEARDSHLALMARFPNTQFMPQCRERLREIESALEAAAIVDTTSEGGKGE
jgi:tetratricopeptide (TPR) repeat protein